MYKHHKICLGINTCLFIFLKHKESTAFYSNLNSEDIFVVVRKPLNLADK